MTDLVTQFSGKAIKRRERHHDPDGNSSNRAPAYSTETCFSPLQCEGCSLQLPDSYVTSNRRALVARLRRGYAAGLCAWRDRLYAAAIAPLHPRGVYGLWPTDLLVLQLSPAALNSHAVPTLHSPHRCVPALKACMRASRPYAASRDGPSS